MTSYDNDDASGITVNGYVETHKKVLFWGGGYAFLSRDDDNPRTSQLIQIYNVDWIDVYDTHNIEHRTEPVSH